MITVFFQVSVFLEFYTVSCYTRTVRTQSIAPCDNVTLASAHLT